MTVDFCVDRIENDRIDGWAWDPEHIHNVLTVEMVSEHGEAVARTAADVFRADLATADKRSGWCAFSLPIPDDCAEGSYRVRVRLVHDTVDIAGPFLHIDRNAAADLAIG